MTDPDARNAVLHAGVPVVDIRPATSVSEIDAVVSRAQSGFVDWSQRSVADRRRAIDAVVQRMRDDRVATIALMGDETGKTIREADPEVSEAIDFAAYYSGPALDVLEQVARDGIDASPRGPVAVIGPWNFPYAIPAGGVFAALAAGNSVVLKPAPESTRVGAWLVRQLHAAGIPDDVVQLVVCEDGPVGRHLVTHPDVDTVVLTGSLATAEMFRSWRPDLRLFAETSGKNSLVITAAADLDLAIADLVRSAFGHAGQKCSAASLAIVEASLYDDPAFMRRLRDVVTSWRVGWPSDPAAMIGPVITPPAGPLERGLTTLEPGESWLVEPAPLDDTGRLWSPGVRTGVRPGSWYHRTECFGPVLGVIRADDLDHAIAIQNDSDFGLTGGIHSLDPGEIERWVDRVEVGNAYVNRGITGAVVRRQPFGGWKRSAVGPGAKAGGPNYLLQFVEIDEREPVAIDDVRTSYAAAWRDEFAVEHDPTGLRAESNVLRYRPVGRVVVRHAAGCDDDLARLRIAANITGVALIESPADEVATGEFLAALRPDDRVRLLRVDRELGGLAELGVWYDTARPSPSGRVELVKWLREQAVSTTIHRHGRLPSD